MGDDAAFISAGGYHHHIGLNTWESRGGSPPPPGTTGLYHTAIRYPDREDARRRAAAGARGRRPDRRRQRPRRQRGDLPARPRPERHRALPRPAAGGVAAHAGRRVHDVHAGRSTWTRSSTRTRMPKGYAEGPAAEEAERRLEELDREIEEEHEDRPAVYGSTDDDADEALHRLARRRRSRRALRLGRGLGDQRRAETCLTCATTRTWQKPVEQLDQVTIRFAGDSGDGMQLTGDRFTSETAMFGNDLSTLPDFPAEIRAPAGSLPGVSGFQLHFADHDILTPGDAPNVLVAMNPAALKTNIGDLPKGGTLIVDTDTFKERNLQKAGYDGEPARGRLARGLPRPRGRAHVDDRRRAEGDRGDHAARGGALEELLRARADELALQPADRGDARVRRAQVRQAARDRAGEHDRLQGRLRLRRDLGGLRRLVRGRAGEARARHATGRSPATRRSPTG